MDTPFAFCKHVLTGKKLCLAKSRRTVYFIYFSQQFSVQRVSRRRNTPRFSISANEPLAASNSEQLRISVGFPNGHFDFLIMTPFYSGKNKKMRGVGEGCHFSGHLANEPNSCVAMTGCIGSEDVEFTILSEHASQSGMYRWKRDGNVVAIESPWKVHTFF